MGDLLSVRDLHVRYEGSRESVYAVNGVSLSVREGETCGVIGETGCGKSSMARALVGMLDERAIMTAETAEFRGIDLRCLDRRAWRKIRAKSIAFMPQNSFGSLNAVVRIDEQFRNILRLNEPKLSNRECTSRAKELLARTGIVETERVLHGYAHQLSGGMAQRVVIAMTMIRDPELIIADEPTTGLDLTVLRQIMDLLVELVHEKGAALMVVTHALEVVAQYCETVVVMYGGQVVEKGPTRDVFTSPAHPYTEALLGCVPKRGQPLRLIPGQVKAQHGAPTSCVFHDRCQYRNDERCATLRPPLVEIAPGHWTATFCDMSKPGAAESGDAI